MIMLQAFGPKKDNPDQPVWSADVEEPEEHRQQHGFPVGHEHKMLNKLSKTLFDKQRKVHHEKRDSLCAVDDDTALSKQALVQEHEGVLLGTRGSGMLSSLVGSQEDQLSQQDHRVVSQDLH